MIYIYILRSILTMISDLLNDYIDYKLRKNDILYRFIIVIVIKTNSIFSK